MSEDTNPERNTENVKFKTGNTNTETNKHAAVKLAAR
jgi:hypothetical protein